MSRKTQNLCIVGFLAVQCLLPLRGFLRSELDSRGSFSWNMYSSIYGCRATYLVVSPDGERREIRPETRFHHPERSAQAYRRDHLPELHAFLCRELEEGERLAGRVSCSVSGAPGVELVRGADLCDGR